MIHSAVYEGLVDHDRLRPRRHRFRYRIAIAAATVAIPSRGMLPPVKRSKTPTH